MTNPDAAFIKLCGCSWNTTEPTGLRLKALLTPMSRISAVFIRMTGQKYSVSGNDSVDSIIGVWVSVKCFLLCVLFP